MISALLLRVMNFLSQTCKGEEPSKAEWWADFKTKSASILKLCGCDFYINCSSSCLLSYGTRISWFRHSYSELWIFYHRCVKLKSRARQNCELTLKQYLYKSIKSLAVVFTYVIDRWVFVPTEKNLMISSFLHRVIIFLSQPRKAAKQTFQIYKSTSEINSDQSWGNFDLKFWYIARSGTPSL